MENINERTFDSFETVEDVMRYYKIENLITEATKPTKGEEDDKDKKTEENHSTKEDPLQTDKYEVVYSEYKKGEEQCIFEHIILFTNNKDPKDNKTLKNIIDAQKAFGKNAPKLHMFLTDEVTFKCDDSNILNITDSDEDLEFTDDINNTNTLVFSRLGVQGEENCEHIVSMLQDRGFIVLNPVRYSALASNKYDTAVLLQKAEIPQPRFCLMNKEICYDEKLYKENMKTVYDEWSDDSDKNEELKFVVKILDGHGGTGVFMCDGKKIYAILQTLFAVNAELQLIIQRKEEADGGDIRVHVLTLRNKQVILGAMKRVKIGGDFRSNVSLGAEAEPVKLTPEQEQIALKTAKVSKLAWCAVDIMPLVKRSNKELGDNVVLEINASPGTDGISDVLKNNFVNILLNELNDPKEFMLQDKIAGYLESVNVDFGKGGVDVLAKLDTGNGAIASHIEVGTLERNGDKVSFKFGGKKYTLDVIDESKAVTGDQKHNRPIVVMKELKLGQRKVKDVPMALVESRGGKSSNMLLNRECLSWLGYVVSPSVTHVLTEEMEKIKIV